MRSKKICIVFILFCLFPGCSVWRPLNTGDIHILEDVPFFKQDEYHCGPAALATVINYSYIRANRPERVDIGDVVRAVYSPTARGVLGMDMEKYGRSHGFLPIRQKGSLATLRDSIDKKEPVIILVEYGFLFYTLNHFLVVKGYSGNGIVVNTGRKENEIIMDGELEHIWKKTDYWSLVLRLQS